MKSLDGLIRAAPRFHLSRRWSRVICRSPRLPAQVEPTWPHDRLPFLRSFTATASHHNAIIDSYETPTQVPVTPAASSSRLQEPRTSQPFLITCPGCGAMAQTIEAGEPGYYDVDRRAVSRFLKAHKITSEDARPQQSCDDGQELPDESKIQGKSAEVPHCDRCHDLVHHSKGVSIAHPTMQSIEDTIAESDFRYNHIYHVIDAADFPMSLIKTIYSTLSLAPQRSKNRRSKHAGMRRGRKTEMSFIITRSDLLAPTKEQVDRLMPYMVEVLRDALGRQGRDVRLGNVRCVSAKRGWWTKNVKADIWLRGGAGWMVGKVNVGKSNLFEAVFPKGGGANINLAAMRESSRALQAPVDPDEDSESAAIWDEPEVPTGADEEKFMLPPARPEEPYPTMPTISSLPGTTASPIRIPFGKGKGELIDMPGVARSDLEKYVRPDMHQDIVMRSRVAPQQYSIKPGQSLLLGGLVRITPLHDDLVFLAYPFVPIKPHLTSTQKAVEMENGQRSPMIETIVNDNVLGTVSSAGRFPLRWDVTRQRAGPLVAKSAVGLKPSQLAFKVLSVDLLIESLGWVELVCQVRRRDYLDEEDDDAQFPEVEVFSPEGKFISTRRPMGAWLLSDKARMASGRRTARPRKSMVGAKKAEKQRRRAE